MKAGRFMFYIYNRWKGGYNVKVKVLHFFHISAKFESYGAELCRNIMFPFFLKEGVDELIYKSRTFCPKANSNLVTYGLSWLHYYPQPS